MCNTRFRNHPSDAVHSCYCCSYGDFGHELINVTYSGDTLIATKVTGDDNVPRGALTFEANLAPVINATGALKPIKLFDTRSKIKWGVEALHRYPGQGYVASKGYVNRKVEDGQLVMFDKHFSFVWTEQRRQIIFGRPSDEVTIQMLRDIVSHEDELDNQKTYVERCFQMDEPSRETNTEMEELQPFRRIPRVAELNGDKEAVEPDSNSGPIWKWKKQNDGVLREDNK